VAVGLLCRVAVIHAPESKADRGLGISSVPGDCRAKAASSKGSDRIPFKVSAPLPIFFSKVVSDSSRRTRRICAVFALLGLSLMVVAIVLARHLDAL